MPTYQYHCDNCAYEFKSFETMSNMEGPTKNCCSKCKQFTIVQGVTAAAIIDPVVAGVTRPPAEFTRDVLNPALKAYDHDTAGNRLKRKYEFKR